jgi:hypothetical protein
MNSLIVLICVSILTFLAASLSIPGDFQNDNDSDEFGEKALTDEERKWWARNLNRIYIEVFLRSKEQKLFWIWRWIWRWN